MTFSGPRSRRAALLGALVVSLLLALIPALPAQAATPFVFTSDSPPTQGTAGGSYSYTFVATGGPGATNPDPVYTAEGELPAGLTLSSDGTLAGTLSEAGTYTFFIRASHGDHLDAFSAQHTVTVAATPPLQLQATYGNHQSSTVSTSVAVYFIGPLVARVVDAHGYPVRGVNISYTISGAASFSGGSTAGGVTSAGGLAYSPDVQAGKQPGPVTATASISGHPETSVSYQLTVTPVVTPAADLRVKLTAPATVKRNRQVVVHLKVSNLGPQSADAVVTTLSWPKGWSVTKAGGGTLSGRQLTFAADPFDSDIPIYYKVRLTSPATAGSAKLRLNTRSSTADPVLTNNTTSVTISIT